MESQHFYEFEKSFWQLSRKMSYIWNDLYEQTFPGSQSYILFLIARKGPVKMSALADSLHLTPGAVTTSSDKLINRGYITRTRDKDDRRVVQLALTDKGERTLNHLQHEGREIMKSVFGNISEAELSMLNTLFKQAISNINAIHKETD